MHKRIDVTLGEGEHLLFNVKQADLDRVAGELHDVVFGDSGDDEAVVRPQNRN
jgi:hypothetical protein